MAQYRPRTDSGGEGDFSRELATVESAALTPVPPQVSASYVEQNEPVALPPGVQQPAPTPTPVPHQHTQLPLQQIPQQNPMLLQQPQEQVFLQQMPHEPPPPYYPGPPPVEQPTKVTKQNTFKVECKASCSICTVKKGVLEIAARLGVTVSVRSCKSAQQIKRS